jgi:plasmid stabilization system protein ParE
VKAYLLDPQAQAELDEAAVRYEDERPGRGLRFADAVEAAIAVAVGSPSDAPLVPYTRSELELRQRTVRRFPYLVIYKAGSGVWRSATASRSRGSLDEAIVAPVVGGELLVVGPMPPT